ncbi:hypothetical protein OUZ56_020297 [Daphnia magna]|uniref:Uncharacterized protein n=1 Tax=Daphnia magna TaxID=35525 RepID=A0ABQ9ZFL4_9CRUS|nr:hypothetical protein OUZ56_020297 [Daphnia magna]
MKYAATRLFPVVWLYALDSHFGSLSVSQPYLKFSEKWGYLMKKEGQILWSLFLMNFSSLVQAVNYLNYCLQVDHLRLADRTRCVLLDRQSLTLKQEYPNGLQRKRNVQPRVVAIFSHPRKETEIEK